MNTTSLLAGNKCASPEWTISGEHTSRRKLYDTSSRYGKEPAKERSYREKEKEYGTSLENVLSCYIVTERTKRRSDQPHRDHLPRK